MVMVMMMMMMLVVVMVMVMVLVVVVLMLILMLLVGRQINRTPWSEHTPAADPRADRAVDVGSSRADPCG